MVEWETIRLPSDLAQKVDKFLETKFAKEIGFTSRSQVVVNGVREFLAKNRYFTFYLKSKKFGKKLKFNKKGSMIFCADCNSQVCNHAVDLFKHKRLFDFDLLDDGDVLAGINFDKK